MSGIIRHTNSYGAALQAERFQKKRVSLRHNLPGRTSPRALTPEGEVHRTSQGESSTSLPSRDSPQASGQRALAKMARSPKERSFGAKPPYGEISSRPPAFRKSFRQALTEWTHGRTTIKLEAQAAPTGLQRRLRAPLGSVTK